MRYLFITDNSYQENNPGFLICRRLASVFTGQGHQVTILGTKEIKAAPSKETIDGIQYIRFYYPINPVTRKMLNQYRLTKNLLGFFLGMLRHPIAATVGVLRAATGFNPIERIYARHIQALGEEAPFDAIVAFPAPYYTALGLARAKTGEATRIIYMLDPYATHPIMGGRRAFKQEEFALKRVDYAIVTLEILEEYQHTPLAAYCSKMQAREFPCVQPSEEKSTYKGFDSHKINLLFAGNLYAHMRPLGYLLRVLDAVEDDRICLTLMGHQEGLTPAEEELLARLVQQGKMKSLPPQPPETAFSAIHAADVLVNIGNNQANMLPSKLYDYISTGRPIVNICRLENCPSLPRLRRYPFVLTLFEKEDPASAAVHLQQFCIKAQGCRLSTKDILAQYHDCTPQSACEAIQTMVALHHEANRSKTF